MVPSAKSIKTKNNSFYGLIKKGTSIYSVLLDTEAIGTLHSGEWVTRLSPKILLGTLTREV
jgi:hypothetical protein